MSASYTVHLTDGTVLTDIASLEANGVGNQSTPRRILDIDFSTSPPKFVVGDDVTSRFVPGFSFEVFDSAYGGVYTVAPAGATSLDGVSSIPVNEPIALGAYTILGVSDTADYWKVTSAGNDSDIFYPTSSINVTGNSVPAANTAYTVVNAVTALQSVITGVETGPGGSWTINGVHNQTYDVGDQITVSGTGSNSLTGDGNYTIASKSVDATTTTLTVMGTIPPAAVANGVVNASTPYTKIFVTGSSIPTGATAGGSISTPPPSQFAFSAPPAIVLSSPNVFDITWRITGDHTSRFTIGGRFNIKDNSYFDYHVFVITAKSFSAGMTHVTGRITSATLPTPDASGFLVHPIAATQTGYIQYEVTPAASSLQLMGKGAPFFNNDTTWGHALMNNAVHQLEHHADDVPPVAPLQGQIWYDMSVDQHRVLAPTNVSHAITNVNVGTKTFTIAGDFTTAVEFQSGEKIEVYNNVGLGLANHEFTVADVTLNAGNTDIEVVEAIAAADVSGMLYGRYMWNGLVTATIPTTNYVDMNGYPIVHVEDIPAAHEYTILGGDTPFDTDFQSNALNLRSANLIYVNVTGDTMTGDLTMGTGTDINMTNGDITMNAASTMLFPVSSTGDIVLQGANDINFDGSSTGTIFLDGANDVFVAGTGRVDFANNEQRMNGTSFISFAAASTGDIVLQGANDINFPVGSTGDITVAGDNDLLFAGSGRVDLAANELRMNSTSFMNFPVGSTGDVTLRGANDIVFSGTGIINMGNNKITNLADATVATDALNMQTGDARYVNVTGDTMTGALSMTSANITMTGTSTLQFTGTGQVDMGTNKVVNLATPTAGTDATNKAYVDAFVSGIVFLTPVKDPNVYNDILSSPPLTPQPYHRTYLVKPAAYTITGRTTGASGKWIISGNHATLFTTGDTFVVDSNSDSPSNGTYTVASAADVSATTEITITGTVPASAGSDGTAYHSSGDWNGLDGHAVSWDGTVWVDVLGRAVQSGDRFGIYMEPDNDEVPIDTSGMGANLIANAGKIGTIQAAVTAPGFLSLGTGGAWSFYTPVEPDAVSVTGQDSLHFGHSYTFRGTYATGTYNSAHKWIEFSGPTAIVDGAGLKFTANVLNIGAGTGIIVNGDTVAVDPTFVTTTAAPDIDINLATNNISTTSTGWGGVTTEYGIPATATGDDNVSLGRRAMRSLTTGYSNIAMGPSALRETTSGGNNIALGDTALFSNILGNSNIAIGFSAMANSNADDNIAIGRDALRNATSPLNTTAIGTEALYSDASGAENTAVGAYSLWSNTFGYSNTAMGVNALNRNTGGYENTAVGYFAANNNTIGDSNTAVGVSALYNNHGGAGNVAVGSGALSACGKAIGATSLVNGGVYVIATLGTTDFTTVGASSNTVGTTFTATGPGTGTGTAGRVTSNNTAIGYGAGDTVESGSNNVLIGGYGGTPTMDGNIVLSTGNGTIRFQHDGNAWSSATPISTVGVILPGAASPVTLNGSAGTVGQTLTSAGPGATPTWKTLSNSTGAPVVITPPASTVAYQNTTAYPMQILVQGGTVTLISISRDDTTYYDIGVIAGAVMLAPNDYIKLTYSVAPTMTGFPQ